MPDFLTQLSTYKDLLEPQVYLQMQQLYTAGELSLEEQNAVLAQCQSTVTEVTAMETEKDTALEEVAPDLTQLVRTEERTAVASLEKEDKEEESLVADTLLQNIN